MRKFYLGLFVLFFPFLSFAQLENVGMEYWRSTTSSGGSGHTADTVVAPVAWYGSDSLIIALGESPVGTIALGTTDSSWHRQIFEESEIVHSGYHSAKIMTVQEDSFLIPGVIANAVPSINLTLNAPYISGISFSGGSPVSAKPTTVSAWVKYSAGKDSTGRVGNDSAILTVQALSFFAGEDSAIGTASVIIGPTGNNWVQVTANIAYTDTVHSVDTLRIAFASSQGLTGLDSSTLYVDDITMTSIPNPPPVIDHTGINTISAGESVTLYPNPTSGILFIDAPLSSLLTCKLYAVNGASVANCVLRASHNQLDISSLANGLYFYEITDSNNTVMQRGKISVER